MIFVLDTSFLRTVLSVNGVTPEFRDFGYLCNMAGHSIVIPEPVFYECSAYLKQQAQDRNRKAQAAYELLKREVGHFDLQIEPRSPTNALTELFEKYEISFHVEKIETITQYKNALSWSAYGTQAGAEPSEASTKKIDNKRSDYHEFRDFLTLSSALSIESPDRRAFITKDGFFGRRKAEFDEAEMLESQMMLVCNGLADAVLELAEEVKNGELLFALEELFGDGILAYLCQAEGVDRQSQHLVDLSCEIASSQLNIFAIYAEVNGDSIRVQRVPTQYVLRRAKTITLTRRPKDAKSDKFQITAQPEAKNNNGLLNFLLSNSVRSRKPTLPSLGDPEKVTLCTNELTSLIPIQWGRRSIIIEDNERVNVWAIFEDKVCCEVCHELPSNGIRFRVYNQAFRIQSPSNEHYDLLYKPFGLAKSVSKMPRIFLKTDEIELRHYFEGSWRSKSISSSRFGPTDICISLSHESDRNLSIDYIRHRFSVCRKDFS